MIWHGLPWHALFGGMLLGLSASVLLAFNGKIAGISGIVSGLLTPNNRQFCWRGAFTLGLIAGGALAYFGWGEAVAIRFPSSVWTVTLAGLCIGFGAKLGNGCTSGHGICGVGRLSHRSMVATMTFMIVAFVTVFVRLHML